MSTQKEVADHIDLSTVRLRELVKRGVIPPSNGPGDMNLEACRIAYIRWLRGKATGKVKDVPSASGLNTTDEKARLTHHQANMAELEERVRRGDLLEKTEVVDEVSTSLANMRGKLLNLPIKTATAIVGVDDPEEIRTILEGAVCEALEELHNQYVPSDERSGAGAETAAETES